MKKPNFKVGERVRVHNRRNAPIARILHFMKDIPGGVVLDTAIDGLRLWNIEDLTKVR